MAVRFNGATRLESMSLLALPFLKSPATVCLEALTGVVWPLRVVVKVDLKDGFMERVHLGSFGVLLLSDAVSTYGFRVVEV